MDRRSFLGRMALVVGGTAAGRNAVLEEPLAAPLPAPASPPMQIVGVRRIYPPTMVSSGGLCTPLSPCYSFDVRPVRGALPSFKIKRGNLVDAHQD